MINMSLRISEKIVWQRRRLDGELEGTEVANNLLNKLKAISSMGWNRNRTTNDPSQCH